MRFCPRCTGRLLFEPYDEEWSCVCWGWVEPPVELLPLISNGYPTHQGKAARRRRRT